MKEAYAMARKNPRIDMMLWFLLRDEPGLGGWQSGLLTRTGDEEARVQRVSRAAPRLSPIPASSALSAAAPTTSVTIVRSPDHTRARSIGITEIQ